MRLRPLEPTVHAPFRDPTAAPAAPPEQASRPSTDVDGIYRRHARALRAFLLRKTRGDEDRADDLLQDVFLAAAADLDRRPAEAPVLAWLYTVAQRRFADDVRRRGRQVATLPLRDEVPRSDGPVEYGSAVAQAVVVAVRELTAVQQRVFVAKVLEGRPFNEIAGSLGISEGAARNHLMRGLRDMRGTLARYGVDP